MYTKVIQTAVLLKRVPKLFYTMGMFVAKCILVKWYWASPPQRVEGCRLDINMHSKTAHGQSKVAGNEEVVVQERLFYYILICSGHGLVVQDERMVVQDTSYPREFPL